MAGTGPTPRLTRYRHRVRYFEADQQGVVFNMWYLGYFDEALTQYLAEGGVPHGQLTGSGYDVQLVRSEIDWAASLRWPDEVEIVVGLERAGTTSFTLGFDVRSWGPDGTGPDVPVVRGRTVYVVVATDGSGKRPIPDFLRRVLGIEEGAEEAV